MFLIAGALLLAKHALPRLGSVVNGLKKRGAPLCTPSRLAVAAVVVAAATAADGPARARLLGCAVQGTALVLASRVAMKRVAQSKQEVQACTATAATAAAGQQPYPRGNAACLTYRSVLQAGGSSGASDASGPGRSAGGPSLLLLLATAGVAAAISASNPRTSPAGMAAEVSPCPGGFGRGHAPGIGALCPPLPLFGSACNTYCV